MTQKKCRLCGGSQFKQIKKSDIQDELTSNQFRITDYDYGVTAAIDQCSDCGLRQCLDVSNITQFYKNLNDPAYESSREGRLEQEKALVRSIQPFAQGKRWLDVGAASGAMLEAANQAGFEAVGVEPSEWLVSKAADRNLNIHLGVLPHPKINGPFDVVTLVDVIEHVEDPAELIAQCVDLLSPKGVLILVTPDCEALIARLMKWKWWHYRIAHITYFNLKQLDQLALKRGLKRVAFKRPGWKFDLAYIYLRLMSYFTKKELKVPGLFSKIKIPVNFFDSMFCVYRKVS